SYLRDGTFSPTEKRFYLATDAGVQVYEVFTHPAWRTVAPWSQEVDQMALSPAGDELATASYSLESPEGTTVRLQSLTAAAPTDAWVLESSKCSGLAFSPDARRLAATAVDGDALFLIDRTSGELKHLSESREPKLPLF